MTNITTWIFPSPATHSQTLNEPQIQMMDMTRVKYLLPLLLLVLFQPASANECVILLHGLARSSSSMEVLEQRLLKEGYLVSNVDYPSRHYSIEVLATTAVEEGLKDCKEKKSSRISFVTHSLGGILVRKYLASHKREDTGRVVMLGPPNQGSEVVDKLKDTPGYELINGPAGRQLGTNPDSIPRSLGPVDFELGVIAGTQSINLILSTMLPNPDDGKVSVESTKVEGMTDFIALPTTHPFMMKNDTVIEQTLKFLANGEFDHGKS